MLQPTTHLKEKSGLEVYSCCYAEKCRRTVRKSDKPETTKKKATSTTQAWAQTGRMSTNQSAKRDFFVTSASTANGIGWGAGVTKRNGLSD